MSPREAMQRRRLSWGAVPGERGLRWLLLIQVTVTTTLCFGATMLVGAWLQLRTLDRGFDPTAVVYVTVSHASESGTVQRMSDVEAMASKVAAMPGVRSVTVGPSPAQGAAFIARGTVALEGPEGRIITHVASVGSGYPATLGVPLLLGRDLTESEARGSQAVLVSRYLAQTLWPGTDPLGQSLRVPHRDGDPTSHQVVGVMDDITILDTRSVGVVLVPYGNQTERVTTLMARLSPDRNPSVVLADIAAQVREDGGGLTVVEATTLSAGLAAGGAGILASGVFLGGLALVGLLLAGGGVLGLTGYAMARRRYELGMRMVLGATPTSIIGFSLQETLVPVAMGFAGGTGLAVTGAAYVRGMLSELQPASVGVTTLVAALIFGTALMAALHPALTAASTDPAGPLRSE